MSAYAIVPMTAEHIKAVGALEKQCFGLHAWSEELLNAELNHPEKHYLVVTCEGKTVGYGGFARVLDEAHIMNIAVDKSYRRKGIGRALLEKLLEAASRMGCNAITLEVNAANVPARALYEQAGFTCAGLRPNYYGKGEHAAIYWLYR